jgi:hypothetical protein
MGSNFWFVMWWNASKRFFILLAHQIHYLQYWFCGDHVYTCSLLFIWSTGLLKYLRTWSAIWICSVGQLISKLIDRLCFIYITNICTHSMYNSTVTNPPTRLYCCIYSVWICWFCKWNAYSYSTEWTILSVVDFLVQSLYHSYVMQFRSNHPAVLIKSVIKYTNKINYQSSIHYHSTKTKIITEIK